MIALDIKNQIITLGKFVYITYYAWLLKQKDDSVGHTLPLPPTSSCHVHTVPSNAAEANLCPQWSNCKAETDASA